VKLTAESFDPNELDIVKSDVESSLPVLGDFDNCPTEKSMEKIEKFMGHHSGNNTKHLNSN
jgi:hypothetical protein